MELKMATAKFSAGTCLQIFLKIDNAKSDSVMSECRSCQNIPATTIADVGFPPSLTECLGYFSGRATMMPVSLRYVLR